MISRVCCLDSAAFLCGGAQLEHSYPAPTFGSFSTAVQESYDPGFGKESLSPNAAPNRLMDEAHLLRIGIIAMKPNSD